ncbi:4144_t:CDS:2, partial [Cetraspora pellucida]
MFTLRSVPFLLAITIILFLTITTAHEDQSNLDKRGYIEQPKPIEYHQESKHIEQPKPIEHHQDTKHFEQHHEDPKHFEPPKLNSKPSNDHKFIEHQPIGHLNPEHKAITK